MNRAWSGNVVTNIRLEGFGHAFFTIFQQGRRRLVRSTTDMNGGIRNFHRVFGVISGIRTPSIVATVAIGSMIILIIHCHGGGNFRSGNGTSINLNPGNFTLVDMDEIVEFLGFILSEKHNLDGTTKDFIFVVFFLVDFSRV